MSDHTPNALVNSSSAYLRSATHQPVKWHEWSAAAFDRAKAEDKPILLDIGAVWCHWCHVMDRESYENAETAQVINENFVAIKVDRDERPDVDSRYQAAVSAISGQGGWPLTAFLTPEGKPFFGGTYFPPEDRFGRPSFQRVLLTMANAFKERRSEVDESASSVMQAIEHNESFSGRSSDLRPELVDRLLITILGMFDERNGGFGSQPKFPHPSALDLLLDASSRPRGTDNVRRAALVTLERMARGGMYDHLAGGFHRYSVDERWGVPHFEKMVYDNAGLLRNYVHAFQTFVDPEQARVASETVAWMDSWLSDRELGGFYGSQDADLSLDDDGDYFTWTKDEAAAVLSAEEMRVAELYYDIGEIGDMHHDPAKNVLYVKYSIEEVANRLKMEAGAVRSTLAAAKEKLYAARLLRPTPYIDQSIYTAWNAMCTSAYIEAGRILGRDDVKAFGLKSLDRMMREAWSEQDDLKHVIAYGDGVPNHGTVAGVLEDYAFAGHACLDGWEATGELRYFELGRRVTDTMIAKFYDETGLGFFDTEHFSDGATVLGALSARRKPLQDSPTPGGNSTAAALLLRIASLTGDDSYTQRAQDTLETFGGIVEHFGLYAAAYGLALQRLVQPEVQVCILGDDEAAENLETIAIARYAVNKSVIRLTREQLSALPPSLAETLPHLPQLASGQTVAVVCKGNSCLPPVTEADALIEAMNQTI